MVLDAFWAALIVMFGYADNRFFGTSMLQRPIVLAPLVGLAFGDFQKGVIIGGTLELIWMGMMNIGAAVPADIRTGSVLGTAFAILLGKGPEVALALAVPISLLANTIDTGLSILYAGFAHKGDRYAEEGNTRGIAFVHLFPGILEMLIIGAVNFLAILLGAEAMQLFIQMVPQVILDGLSVASGLLPAVGFAMLINLMISKRLSPYLFIGFLLAVFLKLNTVAIALFAILLVLLKLFNNRPQGEAA